MVLIFKKIRFQFDDVVKKLTDKLPIFNLDGPFPRWKRQNQFCPQVWNESCSEVWNEFLNNFWNGELLYEQHLW